MSVQQRAPLALVESGAEVQFYLSRATRGEGAVLILGCANGKIAWELSAANIPTVAVDPSSVMVKAAEERRASEPLEVSDRVRFWASDLRSLRLPDKFHTVMAPQNAAGLMAGLDDLEALFATARAHLTDSGTFLFDVYNPSVRLRDAYELGEAPSAAPSGGPVRPVFAPHLRERQSSVGEAPHISLRRLRLRPFFPDEVDGALARSGFQPLEKYGGFREEPFEDDSPIQVVVAAPS
jgi:SAM-dependent methyltransferase